MTIIEAIPPRTVDRRRAPAWAGAEPLVTAREAAELRRCSLATLWRDVKTGRLPKPLYLAPRRPRWRLCDVLPQNAAP